MNEYPETPEGAKPVVTSTRKATIRYQAADRKLGMTLAELIVFTQACIATGVDPSTRVGYDNTWRGTLRALYVDGPITQEGAS